MTPQLHFDFSPLLLWLRVVKISKLIRLLLGNTVMRAQSCVDRVSMNDVNDDGL